METSNVSGIMADALGREAWTRWAKANPVPAGILTTIGAIVALFLFPLVLIVLVVLSVADVVSERGWRRGILGDSPQSLNEFLRQSQE